MSFSSLFFLFFFLPVFLLAYYKTTGIRKKNIVLLAASLIFYCWGGVRYLLLLLAMTAVGWLGGLQIRKYPREDKRRKRWLILSVVIFLAVLGIFKYTGFFLGTFGALFRVSGGVEIALPLGISFYTFKLISYVADVYREKTEPEETYWMLLLYTSIFHQCTQGPIVRYEQMRTELRERRMTYSGFLEGAVRFCVGLGKKAILADHCGEMASAFLPLDGNVASAPAAAVWLGSLCYMLQLYLDFSAYSDMALGLGRMAGFHYPENFNYPYMAVSVKDFWRRWHISLSSFFRDYVYIPLGGSRCSLRRTTLNLLAVWALTGLWHGASWNFVLWGIYYFAFIVLENYWKRIGFQMRPALSRLYTLAVVFFGWIFFRFEDFGNMGLAFRGLLGLNGNGFTSTVTALTLKNNILFLIVAVLAVTPVLRTAADFVSNLGQNRQRTAVVIRGISIRGAALLLIVSVMMLAGSSYTPFLYNQF